MTSGDISHYTSLAISIIIAFAVLRFFISLFI
jgi:hypothetical protein